MPASNQANSPTPSSTVRRHRLADSPVGLVAIGVRCRSVPHVAEHLDAAHGGRTWRSAVDGRFGPGYALARLIATPLFRLLWRCPRGRWWAAAAPGSGDCRCQPRLVLRFRRADHDGPPHAQLRRQGRVPRQLEDAAAVTGVRHDPRRSQRRAPRRGCPQDRRRGPAGGQDVRHLPGRHPLSRRRPARRPHRRRLPRDGHGRTDRADGIVGTDRIQPPGTRVPRPFRPVTVRFGNPIDPADYAGSRRHRRRLITTDVMTAIQALSGQTQAEPAIS